MFWSGGASDSISDSISECYSGDVFMYDIQNDAWSACPKRRHGGYHRSFCMNGKLYIFCSKTGQRTFEHHCHKSIERLDVKAHTQGQSVNWENFPLSDEFFKLMWSPVICPISEHEIVSLSFGWESKSTSSKWFQCPVLGRKEGGVTIFNVQTNSMEKIGNFGNDPKMFGRYLSAKPWNCRMTRNGQIAAAVYVGVPDLQEFVMTYTRGDSKIRVHREDPEKVIRHKSTEEIISDFDVPITEPTEV